MKKNVYRFLTATFAIALVVASPATSITSNAQGFINDGTYDETDYGKRPSGNSSSDSGSSSSSDSGSSSSSDNGSSYDGGPSELHGFINNGTYDETDYGVKPSNNANDVTVSVTGGQKFRIVMNADHKSYQVFHCGISKATFVVADADGNTATYSNVALAQGEDGLWYMNITFPQGVDTTGYAVGVTKGDATYLSTTLGVSGIKVNSVLALSTVPATDAK